MKNIHKDNDLYLIPGHDLNRMIALTQLVLKLKPNLNELLMNWLGYLHDIKPQDNDEWYESDYELDEWEDWYESWSDDFVNKDGSIQHKDLNDLMWKMGLKLPSWDDDSHDNDNIKSGDNDEK